MNKTYYWFGVYLLFLQILVIFRNVYIFEDLSVFVYFCDHIPLILAIAFLREDVNRIKTFVIVGFIPQLVWTIDFFANLLFNAQIFGHSSYSFELGTFSFLVTLGIHLLTCIPAFFLTLKTKTENNILLYSFGYLIFLYIATLLFTSPAQDFNCVYNACSVGFLQFPSFILFWIAITFGLVVIPTFLIMKVFSKIYERKEINES